MSDMSWRDKDDHDLTSEDISAMAAEGQPVGVRGPHIPSAARLATASQTFGATTTTSTYRPAASGVRVSPPVPA